MSILPIVTYNDPVLRDYAEPVTEFNDELKQLIQDMFDTMYNSEGVGLAAPQINQLQRIFVIDPGPMLEESGEEFPPTAFINPQLLEKTGRRVPLDEGCLSFPHIRETVFRHDTITIKYTDQNFEEKILEISGWVSRIIQHELDHLNGVLFIDYLSPFKKTMLKSSLKDIDEGRVETSYPIVPR